MSTNVPEAEATPAATQSPAVPGVPGVPGGAGVSSRPGADPAAAKPGGGASAGRDRRLLRTAAANAALVIAVLIVAVAVWEILVATHAVSKYVLPSPWATVRSVWLGLFAGGTYRTDLWATMKEMLIGFGVGAGVGLVLGTALASSRWVERAILPYVIFMQTVPLVAVAPLLLIWFGFGITPKVVTVSLLVLFPVTVNTLAGLKATSPARIDLLRSFGAGRWDLLRHVRLPAAAPYIFTGLDIGIVYSPVGAIVSEFLGANQGLGIAIFQAQQNLDLPGVFALVLILGMLGIALHLLLVFIRRKVVYWQSFGAQEDPARRGPGQAA